MRKRFILFIAAIITCGFMYGQKSADSVIVTDQVMWIEPMNKYVTLKFNQSTDVEAYSLQSPNYNLELLPNTKSISHLSFNYKFISLSVSMGLKFLPGNDDDEIMGKTKTGGFGIALNFNHWMQDLSWRKTKGFYVDNAADFIPQWQEGDPYPQVPKLESNTFRGITAYKFNSRFSVNAVATQSERQLRSAGSFIPQLLYRYYIINNKETITGTQSTQRSDNFEIILGIGYYHSFVFKKSFYISLGATPGYGYTFSKISTRTVNGVQTFHQKEPVVRIDARAGIGYNSERFFTGLYGTLFTSVLQQENTTAVNQDTRLTGQFFIGYRLNAPKFLYESVEKAQKVIKL